MTIDSPLDTPTNNGTVSTRAAVLEIIKAFSADGVTVAEIAAFLNVDNQRVSAAVSAAYDDKPGDWRFVHRRQETTKGGDGHQPRKYYRYFYDPTREAPPMPRRYPRDANGLSTNPDAIRKRNQRIAKTQSAAAAEPPAAPPAPAAGPPAGSGGETYAKVLHEDDGELVLLLSDGGIVKGRRLT